MIARLVRESQNPITLVAIGPLTNVALLAARYPEEYARLGQLVVMGGSCQEGGNVTSAAEFNIWYDPEAAARVLCSGLSATLVGLDVTHSSVLRRADIERLRPLAVIGSPLAGMLDYYGRSHIKWYGHDLLAMHDSLAVAAVIDPSLITSKEVFVEIDTGTGPARGATLVDRWGLGDNPANARWAVDVDGHRFTSLLVERLDMLASQISGSAG
jgi:inosine-uridine nucleoside N-ribohydrolase